MTPPADLTAALTALLGNARLTLQALPSSDLSLWLIDPANMARAFSPAETQRLLEAPPYWAFCWASGLALARWIVANPEVIAGRQVLDFGSGSGVAGLAAAQAGATRVVCCDLDPLALAACRANAWANGLKIQTLDDFQANTARFELILAADVLYDRANLSLLGLLQARAERILLADSRVRDLAHPGFTRIAMLQACTLPDLAEPDEFCRVALYRAKLAHLVSKARAPTYSATFACRVRHEPGPLHFRRHPRYLPAAGHRYLLHYPGAGGLLG